MNHNRPLPPVTIEDMNTQVDFDDRNYLNTEIAKMFFALKLIQSYGSGLRRAKDAMKANESPKLEFRPADNNDDDYTQAIAYINREYAESQDEDRISIQSKKKRENKANQRKNSGQKRGKNGGSLSEVLTEVISEKDMKKMASIVRVLEEKGCITPQGSGAGYWQIDENCLTLSDDADG